ncbi:prepilin peptidase [Hyphomonas neptunium ATCC 15444]|uniref:Prepilin peptidase n=2 Tax=Hyphomonas TaxID=85 RepID=Q0BYV2_HYPNA|nr:MULTISPECIES: A24 family peptidase [Hyphomonas]ABI76616.1 prepilin peptidase [Hyphomonas neptunium ATCC 15444]KCZ91466.1 prepilin peptidase [Hyphomonas hirschiana VP5]
MTGSDLGLVLLGFLIGAGIEGAASRFAGERRTLRDVWLSARTVFTAIAGALVALAAGLYGSNNLPILSFTLLFGWALLALAAIDLRTYLLPDRLNLAVFLLGAGMIALYRQEVWPWHLAGAITGYGLLWLVGVAYRRLRGVDGLGRGDAKLLGAIGMWVGLQGIPPVLLIASLSGILAVLAGSAIRRESVSGQSMIAFGPWIALAGYIVWLMPALLPY